MLNQTYMVKIYIGRCVILNKYIKISISSMIVMLFYFCTIHASSAANQYSIPVLLYHRIGYTSNALTVTPERLSLDLAELRQNGYETISLNAFEDRWKRSLPSTKTSFDNV